MPEEHKGQYMICMGTLQSANGWDKLVQPPLGKHWKDISKDGRTDFFVFGVGLSHEMEGSAA